MKNLQDIMKEHTSFSLRTFDGETPFTSLLKLGKELEELNVELTRDVIDHSALIEEYVDCIMCLLSSAARADVNIEDLHKMFEKKVTKNINRKWIKNPDGTYSHDKSLTNS